MAWEWVGPVATASLGGAGIYFTYRSGKEARDQAADLARENRTQQRLSDSYLEILKIVEREGLWLRAQVHNWEASAREDEYDPIPRMHVPSPELTDLATVAAHVAAFGSKDVSTRYDEWRATVEVHKQKQDIIVWNLTEGGDPMACVTDEELQPLQVAHGAEVAARKALAEAVATELGHR